MRPVAPPTAGRLILLRRTAASPPRIRLHPFVAADPDPVAPIARPNSVATHRHLTDAARAAPPSPASSISLLRGSGRGNRRPRCPAPTPDHPAGVTPPTAVVGAASPSTSPVPILRLAILPEHRCPVPYSPCEPPSVLLSPPLPRCGHHIPVRSPRPGTSSHAQRTRPGTAALPGALTASCRSTHAPVAQAPASAAAVRRRPLLPRPDLAPSPRRCRARRCPSGCRGARSWAAQPQALCH